MKTTRQTVRWTALALLAVTAVALAGAWLTAPRLGGRMDPAATSPPGTHALATLLRERGVEVVVARTVEDVEAHAGPDTLILFAETYHAHGEELLRRLAAVPGDRLLVEPTPPARAALAPGVRLARTGRPAPEPNCDLRAANRAGVIQNEASDTYAPNADIPVTSCYGGALVRYRADGRTITVVGAADFMTNGSLLKQGNAALAMNLAGERPRLIWFAPNRPQGDSTAGASIADLIPRSVTWLVLQLGVVVVLLALWRGRRLGPLVAERLPVAVRASETVEGRARLYRSRRARDQAAASLREAALQRLLPRLGLGKTAGTESVVAAVARHCRADHAAVHRILFGPAPASDDDLVHLAAALDDIERKVNHP